MTSGAEVDEARRAAQVALFNKIEGSVSGTTNYVNLEHLARAFRFAAGGPQPGGGGESE